MVSATLLSLVRCPECRHELAGSPAQTTTLTCTGCRRQYRRSAEGFLDLRPAVQFSEQTKYLDDALHADARHERVSPPLLGSKIRNDMLRAFLDPGPEDRIVDLGCGSGRALLWNRDWRAVAVGVDIAPFFSSDALREVDLLLADLRQLPFADGTFTRAYSLDVLEHLSPEALRSMLAEANRVLAPGGSLFVYTHVRKNAPVAQGLRAINALARVLERAGLIDMRQERLRKSDHVNPLRDIPELEAVVEASGFRLARIRYYTPIVGGFVENILMRVAERAMARRAARRLASAGAADAGAAAVREVRTAAKARIAASPTTRAVLGGLSLAMKLDLLLFGRIRSGPFFALLEKTGSASQTGAMDNGR
jgi:SAM-dependent methyltransferase